MREINNIGNEAAQDLTFVRDDGDIIINLKFLPLVQIWVMSVTFGDKSINGIKLSTGVLHCRARNFPFDFIVVDNSGNGLDPFRSDDFSNGRCSLYLVEDESMAVIRGQAVG